MNNDYFDDEFENEFTNELFNSLGTPFLFPNPREMSEYSYLNSRTRISVPGGNADFMQPGLLSLQPSLEEIAEMSEFKQIAHQLLADADVDMLEPTISMHSQDPPKYNNNSNNLYQFQSGMSSPLETEMDNNKEYTRKEYEAANLLLDYSQQQPTHQSSSIPTQGIMNAHMSQPLYSQAVYENKNISHLLQESPVMGRDKLNHQGNFNQVPATSSFTNFVPQYLASAAMNMSNNVQTTAQSFSVINTPNNNHSLKNFVDQQQNPLITTQPWYQIPQQQVSSSNLSVQGLQMLRNPQDQQNGIQSMLLNFNQPPQPQFNQLPASNHFETMKMLHSPVAMNHISQSNQQFNAPSTSALHSPIPHQVISHPGQPHLPPPTRPQVRAVQGGQRTDLSHYLPHNEATAPSASLASMLSSRPRQEFVETKPTVSSRTSSHLESVDSVSLNGVKPLGPRHKSESIMSKEEFLNDFENLASSAIGLKRRPPTNGRLSVNETMTMEQTALSTQSSPAPTRRNAPRASTLKKQQPPSRPRSTQLFSEPASVQSFNTESMLSPQGSTPPTDSVLSDESETASPVQRNLRKRRYNGSCSEAADSTLNPEERKRLLHLNAEKNRREALKDGFDALMGAIPVIEEAGIKITNAVVLNKAGLHIRNLQSKLEDCDKKIEEAEKRNEMLQKRVSVVQSSLPSTLSQTGSSSSSDSVHGEVMQFFERYVKHRAKEDNKFYVMGMLLKSVVEDLAKKVDTSSNKSLVRESVKNWAPDGFRVGQLRPMASQTLIKIATETNLINAGGTPTPLNDYIAKEVESLGQYKNSF